MRGQMLLVAALAVAVTSRAYCGRCACCDPYFDPCCTPCYGRFEGGTELLYMTASSDDLIYVLSDPRTFADIVAAHPALSPLQAIDAVFPQLVKRSVAPAYKPGFRAFLAWVACDLYDTTLEYTRLHTNQTDETHARDEEGLWPTFAHPQGIDGILYNPIDPDDVDGQVEAIARARVIYNFDSLELQFARRAAFGSRFWARAAVAVHYFNLDHSFHAEYQGTTQPGEDTPPDIATANLIDSTRSIHLWGVGPKISLEGLYSTACGLGALIRAGLGMCISEEHTNRNETLRIEPSAATPTDETMRVSDTPRIEIIPRFDVRFGIHLTTCFACAILSVELGYEFISYLKAIRESLYIVRALSDYYCENFNMQGPYLRLLVAF